MTSPTSTSQHATKPTHTGAQTGAQTGANTNANTRWRASVFSGLGSGTFLAGAMLGMLVTGKLDPSITLKRLVKGAVQRRLTGPIENIVSDNGFAYKAPVPPGIIADNEGQSKLRLFEDGTELGPASAIHDDIRERGEGRFSHWAGHVIFSTSDNSDPRTNGRTYTFAAS